MCAIMANGTPVRVILICSVLRIAMRLLAARWGLARVKYSSDSSVMSAVGPEDAGGAGRYHCQMFASQASAFCFYTVNNNRTAWQPAVVTETLFNVATCICRLLSGRRLATTYYGVPALYNVAKQYCFFL
jgi:hypothetical protein